MSPQQIIIGIISPSAAARENIRNQLKATGSRCSLLEIEEYCIDPQDRPTSRLTEVDAQIVIVDMQMQEAGFSTLRLLHDVLPEAWLFVTASANDPQLIIKTMQAGAREFFPMPVTVEALTQALARFSNEQSRSGRRKESGKIYCITSAKGGAGTTSVAINLAVATASAPSAKTALLDLGTPVGDVAEYLNLKSKFSIADALGSSSRLDPVLLESYMSHSNGISVLPGYREFHPGLLVSDALARIFRVFSETYTHTFVDMACSQDNGQLQVAAEFSTAVLVVLTPELPALWRTDRLIRLFERTGGSDKLLLIVNRGSKNRDIAEKEIEKTLGRTIYWNLPNNYPAAIQAVNSGKPLVSFNHSSLATSFFELGQMLTGISLKAKRRTLFGF
jgi:pilus assembly protein CpaE